MTMTSRDRKFRRSTWRIVVPAVFPMCRKSRSRRIPLSWAVSILQLPRPGQGAVVPRSPHPPHGETDVMHEDDAPHRHRGTRPTSRSPRPSSSSSRARTSPSDTRARDHRVLERQLPLRRAVHELHIGRLRVAGASRRSRPTGRQRHGEDRLRSGRRRSTSGYRHR